MADFSFRSNAQVVGIPANFKYLFEHLFCSPGSHGWTRKCIIAKNKQCGAANEGETTDSEDDV